jgi:hypothetical protein
MGESSKICMNPDARLQQLKRIKLDFLRAKVIGDYVFVRR